MRLLNLATLQFICDHDEIVTNQLTYVDSLVLKINQRTHLIESGCQYIKETPFSSSITEGDPARCVSGKHMLA